LKSTWFLVLISVSEAIDRLNKKQLEILIALLTHGGGGRPHMKQWMKEGFLYYVAGVLLVLAWLSSWFLITPLCSQSANAGWMIWAVGIVLIFLPMFVLRSKGKPEKGKNWTHTSVIVDKGIYVIVRHPLYLGWLLMYIVVYLIQPTLVNRNYWNFRHGMCLPDFKTRRSTSHRKVWRQLQTLYADCAKNESLGRDHTADTT
jgi:hypothetical protein